MKIKLQTFTDHGEEVEIDVGCREATLRDVFNGVGIPTDQGLFGIAQRDAGIEVMLDGKLVWSSTSGLIRTAHPSKWASAPNAQGKGWMPHLDEKLDNILALLKPKDVQDAVSAAEMFAAAEATDGPCPSCGCDVGRDHRPGCKLPGLATNVRFLQRESCERRERCIVLWNAVRLLVEMGRNPPDGDDLQMLRKLLRIAAVALEGGPLGHQGEIVDGVDRLSLDDLERASGATAWSDPACDAIEIKRCPGCGEPPELSTVAGYRYHCQDCGIDSPWTENHEHSQAIWNAVVDAWNGGFATAGEK